MSDASRAPSGMAAGLVAGPGRQWPDLCRTPAFVTWLPRARGTERASLRGTGRLTSSGRAAIAVRGAFGVDFPRM